jgi:hypothetical protein
VWSLTEAPRCCTWSSNNAPRRGWVWLQANTLQAAGPRGHPLALLCQRRHGVQSQRLRLLHSGNRLCLGYELNP